MKIPTVSITIPTLKTYDQLKTQIDNIKIHTREIENLEIYAACFKQSAAKNRNTCINNSEGDIIIMIDDDIQITKNGWCTELIKPLIMNPEKYSITSARCLDKNGKVAGLLGDCGSPIKKGEYQTCIHTPHTGLQLVASACIAFTRKDAIAIKDSVNLPFDENYVAAVYEDSDYCQQMRQVFPEKDIIFVNNCDPIHLNNCIGRTSDDIRKNQKYFNKKWGTNI